MVFAHPYLLWLLAVAPAVAYAGWRGDAPRRRTVAALRALCLAALVLALAGPMAAWRQTRATTVGVIDLGPSTSDAAIDAAVRALPPADAASPVVVFASRAAALTDRQELTDPARRAALRQRLSAGLWADDAPAGGSNLAAALQLAGAQVPPLGRGEVRVFTPGRNDHGDAAAEAWRLAGRGLAVHAEATDVAAVSPPVRVTRVAVPGRARAGQTVRADVTIDAAVAGRAVVRLTPGDAPAVTVSADVVPGENRVSVSVPLPTPGVVPVRAAVSWEAGSVSDGAGEVLAAVRVRPPADVLLVQDDATPGLGDALAALLGGGVRITPVSPDAVAARAAAADAVVLADVPADRLSAAAQVALQSAVRGGTGLLLTGAARSFGPGGYDDSGLARLLPVKMPQQAENIDPSTTLVLIIDTSGSMSGDRMDLAKEIARLAIGHLKSHDKVGIVEFYGGKRWAAPIQSAGNVSVIGRALDRLTAGGGTTLYPAVEEAAFALRNVRTRSKNLLVLSDGMVEDAPFGSLVRQMAEDGVSVSTAQVGPNEASQFGNQMADIARWGNGRFYTVPDAFGLPDVQFKQPQISLVSPVVRTPTNVVPGEDDLVRGAAAGDFAPVAGYVRTEAKPTADVLLKTAGGDPLVARWRYGAGYVAAMPTQLGSAMTSGLQNSAAFGRLLGGLVRQLDDGRGEPLSVAATVRPAGVEVDVTATTTPNGTPAGPLGLTLANVAGQPLRRVTAEPVAPGRWNVLLPGVTAGAYGLDADAGGAAGTAAVAAAPPQAVAPRTTNRPLLAGLEAFSADAAANAAKLPAERPVWVELRQALVVLAVVLLVSQVAVRRWPLSNGR